ncbi:hypothetical protein [Noviherbaspirillum aridicola]|uniref:Uncharacterized protein n=1 Tax=Noviherbaspirillum aridicola TaxID=2849687 RepID=A0ABQ4Q3T1_9BURK|nr:hypothetical protein [Noviherbaspirillum aridicola]GIZ51856.1 hypothetical protein NCCP691_18700 [Noviherbaspirillum aridicola]
MPFNADAVTLALMALLAALIIGIVAYAVSARGRAGRRVREAATIRAAIIEYFRRSGVQVAAECTTIEPGGRYIVMVESEPMKRFRLSHIIEMTVREHVRKTCGVEVDKMYWRFPIKEAGQEAAGQAAEKKAEQTSDEYINEGLEHYRHIPRPEVTEVPWESFEQVSSTGRDKDGQESK